MKSISNKLELLSRLKRIAGQSEALTPSEKAKVAAGVPLQKIMGLINYDDLPISVQKHVFIPRLETVEVVNFALQKITQDMRVLDLCTGSGYIGLTIRQKVKAQVVLADIDSEAVAQARENALQNNLSVEVIKSNLFERVTGKFDVIVANPPYLPLGLELDAEITNYEPALALWGGVSGNDFYAKIISEAPRFLNQGGWLIFEIGINNEAFLVNAGFEIKLDINQKPRIAYRQFN